MKEPVDATRCRSPQAAWRWLPLLTVIALFIGSCDRREPAAEIRIGFLPDRSLKSFEFIVKAARLAVAEANAAGGVEVDGRLRTVELLLDDTGDTPEWATRASIRLINQEKVVAIVGSSLSRNALPSGGVAEQAGIPIITPGATHPKITAGRRFVFRVAIVDSFQGRVMARFAREDLELTTAAVLYDTADAYSRGLATVFRQAFEEDAGRVVAFESFTSGEESFISQLERIRDADPEALFLPNFSPSVMAQSRDARRLGINAVILGSDSWPDARFKHGDLNRAFRSLSWHPDLASIYDQSRDFLRRYRRAYGTEPGELEALTYDAFGLLIDAISRAPDADPEAIRGALAQTAGFTGVTGPISYRNLGGDPRRKVVIGQFVEGELRLFKLVDPDPEAGAKENATAHRGS